MSEIRTCTKCGKEYPLTAEYWHERFDGMTGGFRTACKSCRRECSRQYNIENRDKVAEYNRQYRIENRDKVAEYNRQYRIENRDKVARRKRQYRIENPEKCRQYRIEKREKYRQWYYKNRETHAEHSRQWRTENRHKIRAYSHRRRARKLSLPTLWSGDSERQMFSAWNHCCAYCGSQQGFFNEMKMSADHYIPLNMAEVCPGTVPWNMVPACQSCNSSKSDKEPRQWLIDTFGKRKGGQKAKEIEAYLNAVREAYSEQDKQEVTA